MRKKILTLFVFCLTLFLGGCGFQEETISVGGHVTLEDGTPLEGVEVLIVWGSYFDSQVTVVKTGPDGWYEFAIDSSSDMDFGIGPLDSAYTYSPPNYFVWGVKGQLQTFDFVATSLP